METLLFHPRTASRPSPWAARRASRRARRPENTRRGRASSRWHVAPRVNVPEIPTRTGSASLRREDSRPVRPFLPFGEQVEGDPDAPFTFTGLRNEDLGSGKHGDQMLSAMFRHLRPGLGRWTQRDPAGAVDGPNLYWYARSRPMLLVDATGLLADWPAILSTLSGIPAGERALMITGRVNPFSGFAPEEDGRVVEELDAGVLKFFVRPGMKTGDSAAVYVHEAEHVQQIRDLVRTRWRSFPAPAITANERVLDEVDAWEQAVEFIESRYQGNALDVIQNAPRNFARWRTWKREGSIALMVDVMQQYSGRYTDIERPCKIVTPLVVRGASN